MDLGENISTPPNGGWTDWWMGGRVGGWMGGWMDAWVDGSVDGWMDGLVDGWKGGWMDGLMESRLTHASAFLFMHLPAIVRPARLIVFCQGCHVRNHNR